jgi:hypothetical protein
VKKSNFLVVSFLLVFSVVYSPADEFSKAQARQPEVCSKFHLGPDHPQKEVYEESKHVYFKFIPEALEYGDPEVNAYIEVMLKTDPMHNWLSRPTADLKEEIRSGKIQEVYKKLFKEE